MNTKFTKEQLATWINNLKELAKQDTESLVHWFGPTAGESFSIVGGWQKLFDKDYSDLFCCSKSQPEYVMCIKIVVNEELWCPDFESLNMPWNEHFEEVDDTSVPLEWDDSPEAAAEFFIHEWERIMRDYGEKL